MPPHPTSWRSILILSFHLSLGSPKRSLSLRFPHQKHYIPLFSPIRATCPAYLILLYFITQTIFGEYISLSSPLCSFLHCFATSSILGQNILLSTLFSNILRLRHSLNVNDQHSLPYKTTGKNRILYILIFKYLDSKLEDKRFCTE